MTRYVSTKGSGGSGGGSGGISATDVCNTICKLATQSPANQPSPLIMPGFGCWQMICNCPCWTDCYGCCMIWNVDTTKYRAFRIQYTGIRNCACCYTRICPGFANATCFCNCSNTYRGACVCMWPMKSCCCWEAYNCSGMQKDACIYCCGRQWDNAWSFKFTICAPQWKGCTSGSQGQSIFYDFQYARKFVSGCDCYNNNGWDRFSGMNFCSCLFWSCKENDTQYVTRMCLKVNDTPFQSLLASGNYPATHGGCNMVGTPCWTIWGMPCDRPEFGTCSMTTA